MCVSMYVCGNFSKTERRSNGQDISSLFAHVKKWQHIRLQRNVDWILGQQLSSFHAVLFFSRFLCKLKFCDSNIVQFSSCSLFPSFIKQICGRPRPAFHLQMCCESFFSVSCPLRRGNSNMLIFLEGLAVWEATETFSEFLFLLSELAPTYFSGNLLCILRTFLTIGFLYHICQFVLADACTGIS